MRGEGEDDQDDRGCQHPNGADAYGGGVAALAASAMCSSSRTGLANRMAKQRKLALWRIAKIRKGLRIEQTP
jgi:hypothetical protein